jgi:CheY-like chemotaxis protein
VALTGYGHDSDRAKSRAAGFDMHLVKPIDLGGLERDIERLLGE